MGKNFIFAVATLVGAIVGLGMFGIPYAASRAGFFVGIGYIVVLGFVMLLLHLIYGEVVERTEGNHRLTGYVEKYLGKKYKRVLGVFIIFALYTALLAYIIVGGGIFSVAFARNRELFCLEHYFLVYSFNRYMEGLAYHSNGGASNDWVFDPIYTCAFCMGGA